MNKFEINEMASGGFALILEPIANWEEFSNCSEKWIKKLNARIIGKPIITIDECIVEITIDEGSFWITYDDFQSSIQLEPKDEKYNNIVLALQKKLQTGT